MSFYGNLAATAQRLLTKYGQTVTLRRVTPGAYNPSSGQAAAPTADFNFSGALFDFKDGVIKDSDTLIEAGDKQLLLEAAAAPMIDDVFIIGGEAWQAVAKPKSINPAGTPVLYVVHLRK